ncbi:MAG: hypothetical protein J6T10_01305 [Methanobrevibacter sp.]|nr:hypothetical protein [Methanobrevibacter sp.]
MVEAKYTKLFKTWLGEPQTQGSTVTNYNFLISSFTNGVFTQTMAQKLVSMLKSVFDYYEIGDKDEMFNFLYDTFNEYYKYYYDVITNYEKEYDYALNNKRKVSRVDNLNIGGSVNTKDSRAGSNTEYQLPNKVIDESYRSTPSNIVDTKDNSNQDKEFNTDTVRQSDTTTEFNNEFIDLKNKYMNQIRNVYREFAMKFKECFYQVY